MRCVLFPFITILIFLPAFCFLFLLSNSLFPIQDRGHFPLRIGLRGRSFRQIGCGPVGRCLIPLLIARIEHRRHFPLHLRPLGQICGLPVGRRLVRLLDCFNRFLVLRLDGANLSAMLLVNGADFGFPFASLLCWSNGLVCI